MGEVRRLPCLVDATTTLKIVHIQDNISLASLEGLALEDALQVSVSGNDALVDLRGLHRLRAVATLAVSGNDQLRSLAAIDPTRDGALKTLTWRLTIGGNPLEQCEEEELVRTLESFSNQFVAYISSNGGEGPCRR
jgi:hypothetical protein